MNGDREAMGAAYIPFTFPTASVTGRMQAAGVNTNFAEVDRLWDAYYLALKNGGLAPYDKKASGAIKAPIINSMAAQTSISKNNIAAWLNALADEAADSGYSYYIDPITSEKASEVKVDVGHPLAAIAQVTKSVGQSTADLLRPSADAVTNVIKYAALALVAGAVIYSIYEFTPLIKGRKKKRGRKG